MGLASIGVQRSNMAMQRIDRLAASNERIA
jgi:hypothetical protein